MVTRHMTARRRAATAFTAAALLGGPAAATAAADPLVVDRFEAGDGTAFTLSARSALARKARAVFTVDADPPEGSTSPYATQRGLCRARGCGWPCGSSSSSAPRWPARLRGDGGLRDGRPPRRASVSWPASRAAGSG